MFLDKITNSYIRRPWCDSILQPPKMNAILPDSGWKVQNEFMQIQKSDS